MIFRASPGAKGLGEFGVSVGLLDEAYDLAGHYCQAAGPNVMYFETGRVPRCRRTRITAAIR